MAVQMRAAGAKLEKQHGPLPSPGILLPLGVPLLFLLTRFGEAEVGLPGVRWLAVGLSLYCAVLMPLTMVILGRFALPGPGLYEDHRLVVSGPFRVVRHPIYSAAIVLWFSASLGMANWLLLVLWPVLTAVIVLVPVRQEERLLREKFGEEYQEYSRRTAGLIPGVW